MGTADRMMATVTSALTPSSDEDAADVGSPSEADAMWAAMTVPHHRTGIELADLALAQATSDGVRDLAAESKQDQESDLPELEKILGAAGRSPMPPEAAVERKEQLDLQMLKGLSGQEFDHHWVDVFSSHHQAAIMMTDAAMPGGAAPGVKALQSKMRSSQLSQLQTLNELHARLMG